MAPRHLPWDNEMRAGRKPKLRSLVIASKPQTGGVTAPSWWALANAPLIVLLQPSVGYMDSECMAKQ